MKTTVLAKFSSPEAANQARNNLSIHGISQHDISVLSKNDGLAERLYESSLSSNTLNGTFSGATAGGVIGAVVGLLIGVGIIRFTGVNWFLIAVPLAHGIGIGGAFATTLSGFLLGAIVGGLVGALMGLSIPDNEVFTYEEDIGAGESIVAVQARPENEFLIKRLLQESDAHQIYTREDAGASQSPYYSPYSLVGYKGGKSKKTKILR